MKSVANGNLNSEIKEKDLEENSKRIESVSRWDDLKVFVAILVITLIAVIVVVVKSAVFLDEVKISRSRNKKTCIFFTQSVNNFKKNSKTFQFLFTIKYVPRMTQIHQLSCLCNNRKAPKWKLLEMDTFHVKGMFKLSKTTFRVLF